MTSEIPEPVENERDEIDILIDQLPERFPAAVSMIKYDIAPQLIDSNPGVKDHYIKLIKKKTNAASIKSVSLLIDEAIREINDSVAGNDSCAVIETTIDPEIIQMAEQIALDPLLFRKKIDIVNDLGVINERKNIGLYQLVIDSRLIPLGHAGSDALAMKNSGHYGAGKSFPLFTTLKLYPKSAYYLISSGSDKSLYSIEGGLEHKALVLAEALALESHGTRDNELAYAIRTLISEGHLKYQYTGFVNKKRVTIVKRVSGPTSLLTTTIKGKLEDQLDDRMINAHPDTSATQTRDIIEQTADTASGNGTTVDEKVLQAYQHFHQCLVSQEVVIPFAKDIAAFIGDKGSLPISARRSFKRVLSAIKTLTLIYQKQRRKDEQGRLIAEYSDYAIVYQLLEESFAESLGNQKRYTDERILMIANHKRMTPRLLSERSGVTTAAISQWAKPLIEKGVLTWCDEKGGKFEIDNQLEKAKRSGTAYLSVAGGKSLPSPLQLTGDIEWDETGNLYAAINLGLGDECTKGDVSDIPDHNCINDQALAFGEGVKVLSEKSNNSNEKRSETISNYRVIDDQAGFVAEQLFHEFSDLLSNTGTSSIN